MSEREHCMDGAEQELLQSLFEHALAHPANWDEWRKTLILFAQAEGVDRETVENAHEAARAAVNRPDAADEVAESREVAGEYLESLPFDDDPRIQDTDTDHGNGGDRP